MRLIISISKDDSPNLPRLEKLLARDDHDFTLVDERFHSKGYTILHHYGDKNKHLPFEGFARIVDQVDDELVNASSETYVRFIKLQNTHTHTHTPLSFNYT